MALKEKIIEAMKEIEMEKGNGSHKVRRNKEVKFKYPMGKKVGKGQRKKNYITTLILNENGTCDFKKYQISDQTFFHDEIPRLASSGHVMFDKKGNPLVILPNWSVEPFSPLEHYKSTLVGGSNTSGYRILLDRMERAKTENKTKMGGAMKWIIGVVLAAIILYAVITGGGA
jgi:hypothetical protein